MIEEQPFILEHCAAVWTSNHFVMCMNVLNMSLQLICAWQDPLAVIPQADDFDVFQLQVWLLVFDIFHSEMVNESEDKLTKKKSIKSQLTAYS